MDKLNKNEIFIFIFWTFLKIFVFFLFFEGEIFCYGEGEKMNMFNGITRTSQQKKGKRKKEEIQSN